MLAEVPFAVEILSSAVVDIVKMRLFYDGLESGLGTVFRDHILAEVDNLAEDAGIDEKRYGYYFRADRRFIREYTTRWKGDASRYGAFLTCGSIRSELPPPCGK